MGVKEGEGMGVAAEVRGEVGWIKSRKREPDLQRMAEWMADGQLEEREVARRMWRLASDPRRAMAVREVALRHALDLTEDEQWEEEVLPLFAESEGWTESLIECVVNDLYHRAEGVRVSSALRLVCLARGETLEELLELLEFRSGEEWVEPRELESLMERSMPEED